MSDAPIFQGRASSTELVSGWPRMPVMNVPRTGGAGTIKLYDVRAIFPDEQRWTTTTEKTGFVFHHDAVVFRDEDRNFNGSTLDESLGRLRTIYDYHRNVDGMREPGEPSWNGIGYHVVVDPAGRLFLAGDVNTHRAHVTKRNHDLIGVCYMGNFADGLGHDGKATGPLQDRPTQAALIAADSFCRFVTTQLGREMTLRPHKYYQSKECPGTWAAVDAWADFRYKPGQFMPPVEEPGEVDWNGVKGHVQRAQRHLKQIGDDLETSVALIDKGMK